MTRRCYRKRCSGTLTLFLVLVGAAFTSQPATAQGLAALDAIVQAHGARRLAPISVQMAGMVQRGDAKPEPFRLVATRDEELRIEYGSDGKDTMVVSQKLNFRDDGTKFEYPRAPSGFSQLDITGLFFVEQLRNRAVRVEAAQEQVTIAGTDTTRLRVESERTQVHKGNIRVNDRADLYVGPNGLLTAISRSFYEGRPERYSQAFLFTDYRKTGEEEILLPYRVEVYVKGQRRQTFLVESYQFDVPTDRELFLTRRAR